MVLLAGCLLLGGRYSVAAPLAKKQCRWFSEHLPHDNAPWLFAAGECYRQIASLELFATLAAVVTFGVPNGEHGAICCSAGTDN